MSFASKARAAALGLLVSLVVPAAHAANCNAADQASLQSCVLAAGAGDTVTLTADITSGSLVLNAANDLEILPNGHAITTVGGGMLKLGAGTVTMSGTNSIAGNVAIAGGAIAVRTAGAVGTFGIDFQGGNLLFLDSMTFVTGNMPLNGGTSALVAAAAGTSVELRAGSIPFGPTSNITYGDATRTGTITLYSTAMPSFGNATSTLTIGGGTLKLGDAGVVNLPDGFMTTTVAAGATLDQNGFDLFIRDLRGAGIVAMGSRQLRLKDGNFAGVITSTAPTTDQLTIFAGANVTLSGTSNIESTLVQGTLTFADPAGFIQGHISGITGTLVSTRTAAITFADPYIISPGTFRVAGTGTAMVTTPFYVAVNTEIQSGALQLCDGSPFPNNATLGTGAILDNARLIVNCFAPKIVQNVISGSGTLEVISPTGLGGANLVAAVNTYSGGTTVTNARVFFSSSASIGPGSVTLTQGGALVGLSTMVVPFVFPRQLRLVSPGAGILAAATGATVEFSGVTSVGADLVAGIDSNYQGTVKLSANFAGSSIILGRTNNVASGTLLIGDSFAAELLERPTTIAGGATLDTAAITPSCNCSQSLQGAGTFRLGGGQNLALRLANFAGTITGNGSITIQSNGTLSGNNDYTGTTQVNGGVTLNLGSGGTGGTFGQGNVNNDGAIVVNRTDAYTVGQAIGGGGTLAKQGAGTLTLAGTNTYSGATSATAGVLAVTGSTALSSTTIAGAELRGTGTTGAVNAKSGKVSPGLSPGILNTGNFAIAAPTSLDIEIDGPTVGTQYDQVNVSGSVSLGGAALNVVLGFAPTLAQVFTIINNDGADAVAGTFAGLAQGGTFVLGTSQFTISYTGGNGNDVTLTMSGTLPGAPTIVSAVPGPGSATVTFNAPLSDGGSPILDYELTCGAVVVTPAVSPQLVSGLANGVAASCTVRARNAIGYGPASAPMSVTPTFRVFSGPSATGTGIITASFTGGGATCNFAPTPAFIAVEGDPGSPPAASKPANREFPHGLFDFSLTGCDATPVTMTITYPAALGARAKYWKYGPTALAPAAHWYEFPSSAGGGTVTFTLVDNADGDSDATIGTIRDPGGIALPLPFLGEVQIPTMNEWMLMLLALLMAGAAWTTQRTSRSEC